MFESIRHYTRYVVNGLALAVAVMTLPELGAIIPSAWLPGIVSTAAIINTILSWVRRI